MQPRRSLRLVAGALVLALPLLSSCGFNKATDKVYTPGEGTNNRDGDVKVLSAVVVAAQPGSGTFIASLSNNGDEATSFTALAGAGDTLDLEVADIDSPPEIEPRGFLNLADEGGVAVTGDFGAGNIVDLTLSFESGDTVTMEVPVVYACDEYAGLDISTDAPASSASPSESAEPTESASESPTESASAEPTDGSTPTPSGTDSASAAPTQPVYDCVAAQGDTE